jgi:hypothetical protein
MKKMKEKYQRVGGSSKPGIVTEGEEESFD